jgi:hypothetical protein
MELTHAARNSEPLGINFRRQRRTRTESKRRKKPRNAAQSRWEKHFLRKCKVLGVDRGAISYALSPLLEYS